ncbi:hypothetical protein ACISSW_28900, partial [Escherichia coli]
MTTLKLDTLSDRIKVHKNLLVQIVKPPVCTGPAQPNPGSFKKHPKSRPRAAGRGPGANPGETPPSG